MKSFFVVKQYAETGKKSQSQLKKPNPILLSMQLVFISEIGCFFIM